MKTLVDYRSAGLDFVEGDICYGYGAEYTNGWAQRANDGGAYPDGYNVKSFAWRSNTGESSDFRGIVEYETMDGKIYTGQCGAVNFGAAFYGEFIVKKWRPLLNQGCQVKVSNSVSIYPESLGSIDSAIDIATKKAAADIADIADIAEKAVKPTYTKAMQEAGELPPVGSECLHTGFINDFENTFNLEDGDKVEILMDYEGGVIFRKEKHDQFGLVISHTCNPMHFKPIQTEREKAIDIINKTCLEQGSKVDGSEVLMNLEAIGWSSNAN